MLVHKRSLPDSGFDYSFIDASDSPILVYCQSFWLFFVPSLRRPVLWLFDQQSVLVQDLRIAILSRNIISRLLFYAVSSPGIHLVMLLLKLLRSLQVDLAHMSKSGVELEYLFLSESFWALVLFLLNGAPRPYPSIGGPTSLRHLRCDTESPIFKVP